MLLYYLQKTESSFFWDELKEESVSLRGTKTARNVFFCRKGNAVKTFFLKGNSKKNFKKKQKW